MRTIMTMIAILTLGAACAEGHDIYSGLKDHLGESSCCDDRDCRPAHYRVTSAGVEMLLDDEWVRVPNKLIQYRSLDGDNGETRGGHWCGVTNWHQAPGFEYPPHPNHPGLHLSPVFHPLRDPAAGALLKARIRGWTTITLSWSLFGGLAICCRAWLTDLESEGGSSWETAICLPRWRRTPACPRALRDQ
jgi:hypothetical protein